VEESPVLAERKHQMIRQALDEHREIFPCGGRVGLGECFTIHREKVLFWFNTRDDSTHVLMMAL
jgi:hypothetical protein